MMLDQGLTVPHTTLDRWVQRYAKDLTTLPERFGCSTTHCCNLLGVATALIGSLGELLDHQSPEAVDCYREMVEAEAQAVGIDDLWAQGSWKVPAKKNKRRPS